MSSGIRCQVIVLIVRRPSTLVAPASAAMVMALLPGAAFLASNRRRSRAEKLNERGRGLVAAASLDADGFAAQPPPADRPGHEMDQSATKNEADNCRNQTLRRGRDGRLVGLIGARGDLRIEILSEHEHASDRAGFREIPALLFKPIAPHDRVPHMVAALLHEAIIRLLQMRNPLRFIHSGLGSLGIEALDQRVELVDRPAKPLAILLRIFRHLGSDDAEEQADQHSNAAEKHGSRSLAIALR